MSKPKKLSNVWMKHRSQLKPRKVLTVSSDQQNVLESGVAAVFFPRRGKQRDSMREVWSNTQTCRSRYFMFSVFITEETHIQNYVYGITKTQLKKRGLCGHRVLCAFKLKRTPSGHLALELEPCGDTPHIQMTHSIRYTIGASGKNIYTTPMLKGVGVQLFPHTNAACAA